MCANLTLYFIVFIHKCNSILFDQLSCTSNYLQIIESIEMLKELYLYLDGIEGFFSFPVLCFVLFLTSESDISFLIQGQHKQVNSRPREFTVSLNNSLWPIWLPFKEGSIQALTISSHYMHKASIKKRNIKEIETTISERFKTKYVNSTYWQKLFTVIVQIFCGKK